MTEPVKPSAWQRKWDADGEVPAKVKGAHGMVWPGKFKWLAVSKAKVLHDDVPLYPPEVYRNILLDEVIDAIRQDAAPNDEVFLCNVIDVIEGMKGNNHGDPS